MAKKTVNHDAPKMYNLFHGDKEGTPGSNITVFPKMADQLTEFLEDKKESESASLEEFDPEKLKLVTVEFIS